MLTVNQKIYLEAKVRVNNIIIGLKKLEKKTKKSKKSRQAIKVMEEFVKCNITSPSISAKYNKVVSLLSEYSNVNERQN